MRTPPWAVGMRKVGVGVYVDGNGQPHLDLAAICAQAGYPPTAENLRVLGHAALEMLRQRWPQANPIRLP